MSGLPKINMDYGNGALGQTISSADGLLCIAVCGAGAVDDTFSLAKLYSLRKTADLTALGVTAANNALLHQTVADFYTEAPEGTPVWVIGYPNTLKMSDVLDKENAYLKNIVDLTNGEIRGLVVTSVSAETPTIENGLDNDIPEAMLNAHQLGEWARTTKYAPLFVVMDGLNYTGVAANLPDLKVNSYFRTAVVIGSRASGAKNQAIGLVAGRIASSSVDRNIGRVADGALNVLNMYAGATAVESADIETIYNKGYLTFRTFTGLAGYYIADDLMATKATDDYNHLTAVRTVDKAARIAYAVLVQQLLDKVEVRSNGTMMQPVIVSWQQILENAISSNMTAQGELSQADDRGVQVYIDPDQDVLATSTINVELRVRPFGYARYINVLLGFTVNEN
ncbi:MAG: DUF2586 family protein [Bacteroidales bacterium]